MKLAYQLITKKLINDLVFFAHDIIHMYTAKVIKWIKISSDYLYYMLLLLTMFWYNKKIMEY